MNAHDTHTDEPTLTEVTMNVCRPNAPVAVRVVKSERCTASSKSAGFVRHVEFDVSGTPLEGVCKSGQSIGVLPPGEDDRGKPHKIRLYSLACPTGGEDGRGKILSTTVKRTIEEHWDNHTLFLGVASNYLCDVQVGDEVKLSGPAGKRFVLPENPADHDYVFFSTGTGIAPFRGFIKQILADPDNTSTITLVSGAPYTTDLLYHAEFESLADESEGRFRYLTAVSREDNAGLGRLYVADRLRTDAEHLLPQLENDRTLIYVCGVAGMELGIFRRLGVMLPAPTLAHYLTVDPEIAQDPERWERDMLHRRVKPTGRVLLEVYA